MRKKTNKVDIDALVTNGARDDFDNTAGEFGEEASEYDEELPKMEIPKKSAIEIMEVYNSGKILGGAAEAQLKELFHLGKKDRLTTAMIYGKTPDGIDTETFKSLVETYQNGQKLMQDAKADMVNLLDMFIYYVIERNFNTFKKYTKDLYQEGVVGILKGIDAYKPEKGKPTTFFFIYILHEMTEFINLNVNKTTSHYSANIIKVKKAINHFERQGRKATIKDIAQETGISAETIAQAINIMESANEVHYETVEYLDANSSQRNPSPEEEYLKNETTMLIQKAVDALPTDEGNVIRLKYGLSGEEPMSYKNISARLGIQIDKVKKLNSAGIRKLRKSKIINGNFKNLQKEEKALNETLVGVVPVSVADAVLDDLDSGFSAEEAVS